MSESHPLNPLRGESLAETPRGLEGIHPQKARTRSVGPGARSDPSAVGTSPSGAESFINEAESLAQFDVPLVEAYRFWEDGGTAFLA